MATTSSSNQTKEDSVKVKKFQWQNNELYDPLADEDNVLQGTLTQCRSHEMPSVMKKYPNTWRIMPYHPDDKEAHNDGVWQDIRKHDTALPGPDSEPQTFFIFLRFCWLWFAVSYYRAATLKYAAFYVCLSTAKKMMWHRSGHFFLYPAVNLYVHIEV